MRNTLAQALLACRGLQPSACNIWYKSALVYLQTAPGFSLSSSWPADFKSVMQANVTLGSEWNAAALGEDVILWQCPCLFVLYVLEPTVRSTVFKCLPTGCFHAAGDMG